MLYSQGRSEMDTIPREPDHWGVPQTPNNVSSILSSNTAGSNTGVKIVTCPGHHLISARPSTQHEVILKWWNANENMGRGYFRVGCRKPVKKQNYLQKNKEMLQS